MHVVLPPGDYALVFGSGQYLATGSGFAPVNNADLPAASFIEWSGGTWSDSAATGKRFVIEGHSLQSVPALTTWGKVAAACVLLAAGVTVMRRRRRVSFR
jgi:hypothetical protein